MLLNRRQLATGDWPLITGHCLIFRRALVEPKVRSYEDLKIWQRSIVLAKAIYEQTRTFPVEERYGITNQLRRAAVSVASNIAEGQARQHTKEFCQFLFLALGSLAEIDTQLIIAKEIGYADAKRVGLLRAEITEIRKMTHTLIQKLSSTQTTGH